jgi:hypothetical protein
MEVIEFLSYMIIALIPAAAVIYVVYIMLKKQGEKEISALTMQLKKERQGAFLEPRVDAYQRAVLLMERISPNNLIMRLYNPSLNAIEFQTTLLETIRKEYEHNLAQQIFISLSGWEMVKSSKEETIKIVNIAARQIGEGGSATDLSAKIFEIVAEVGELPTEITIKQLKEELQRLF